MMKKLIFLLALLLFSQIVLAVTIHGTVYSPYLEKLEGAIVLINTSPKQTYVAINGEYSFNVPAGSYKIEAVSREDENLYFLEQNITVTSEGDYVVDLILFSDFSDMEEIGLDIDLPEIEKSGPDYKPLVLVIIAALAIAFYGYRWYKKKYKKPEPEKPKTKEPAEITADLKKLIEFIIEHDNRVTQKDIRKEFPLSEAKISLMLAELESKGKIQKIKKGRGNIIILK